MVTWTLWMLVASAGSPAGSAQESRCTDGGADPGSAVVFLRQGATACAGALIDSEGTIVTSYHCVADGGRVRVETREGRVSSAKVQARSAKSDLAILKAPDLAGDPWLSLADHPPAQGDPVHAWGHPMGAQLPGGFLLGTLRWSVSQGVVSAVGTNSLQTTAAVNPGNSGGPLLDERGCLVGVVSRRLRAEALGFASRSDLITELMESGRRGSILGGSVRAGLTLSSFEGEGGALAGGAELEIAARDRVVLRGSLAQAFRPTLDALRFDQSVWVGSEATLGLRQRLGHGTFSARVDLYGGIAVMRRVTRVGERSELRTASTSEPGPIVGARISLVNIVLDGALIPDPSGAHQARLGLGLQWPGRLTVY